MKLARIVAASGMLAMMIVLGYAFATGNFAAEGKQLLGLPWGVVSLVDLYVGFALFSTWIVYRDGIRLSSLLWIAAVMTLGSLAICLYVFLALRKSGLTGRENVNC